jgi:hypothetical protein
MAKTPLNLTAQQMRQTPVNCSSPELSMRARLNALASCVIPDTTLISEHMFAIPDFFILTWIRTVITNLSGGVPSSSTAALPDNPETHKVHSVGGHIQVANGLPSSFAGSFRLVENSSVTAAT